MKTRSIKLLQRNSANDSNRATVVSNLCLTIGTCITLAALIYMIVNLSKADSIVTMWFLCMVTGIGIMFTGLLVILLFKKKEFRYKNKMNVRYS
jgi:hypothetical protein